MKKIFILSFTFLFSTSVYSFETTAPRALLIDNETGTVLFEKDADVPMPTASMSKMMTIYMVFEALQKGQLKPTDLFTVSENAWHKGGGKTDGSTRFLNPHQQVSVMDLLKGIIIQSGNDASIVVAENMAGTEEAFANLMNLKAKELGLTNTNLKNATGLPAEGHVMSARDLALLAQLTIKNFPEYYPIYSETEYKFNNIKQGNRNPILGKIPGADGLKTGHTKESGFSLVGSAKVNDRRLIMVIAGMGSMKERAEESKKLISWGMASFENMTAFTPSTSLEEIPVWLGKQKTVSARVEKDIILTLLRGQKQFVKAKITYTSPLIAPIEKGTKIGELMITLPDGKTIIYPVIAGESIEKVGIFGKIATVLGSWF